MGIGSDSSSIVPVPGVRRYPAPNPCLNCGKVFYTDHPKPHRGHPLIYCSLACHGMARRGKVHAFNATHTPESTHRERIRAAGLINKRIKLGIVDRPQSCLMCHKACKPDAHHPDYARPELVVWLCRSCHMKAHRRPEFEKQCAQRAKSTGGVGEVSSPPKAGAQ